MSTTLIMGYFHKLNKYNEMHILAFLHSYLTFLKCTTIWTLVINILSYFLQFLYYSRSFLSWKVKISSIDEDKNWNNLLTKSKSGQNKVKSDFKAIIFTFTSFYWSDRRKKADGAKRSVWRHFYEYLNFLFKWQIRKLLIKYKPLNIITLWSH